MFVYSIDDPTKDYIPFYVGITANLYERFKQHMRCDGTNVQKDRRIQEIMEAGYLPVMRTIEQVSDSQALEREIYWIRHYLSQGVSLVNITVAIPTTQRSPKRERTEDDVRAWIDDFRMRHPEVTEEQIQFMLRVQLYLLHKVPGWTL